MTTQKNKPIDRLRDGALKATIWANESQKGTFYSVEFTRTYKSARGERACHKPQTKRCFSWDLANRQVLEFRVQRESALEHGKPR